MKPQRSERRKPELQRSERQNYRGGAAEVRTAEPQWSERQKSEPQMTERQNYSGQNFRGRSVGVKTTGSAQLAGISGVRLPWHCWVWPAGVVGDGGRKAPEERRQRTAAVRRGRGRSQNGRASVVRATEGGVKPLVEGGSAAEVRTSEFQRSERKSGAAFS